jgi:hypothetical protein
VVKLARNALLNFYIQEKEGAIRFGINTVRQAYTTDPHIRDIIKERDLDPIDKMDMDPVKAILQKHLTDILQQSNNEEEKAVGYYLQQLHQYYNLFENNNINIDNKIIQLTEVVTYFKKLNLRETQIQFHMETSLQSLKELNKLLKQQYSQEIDGTSFFSTLVVENFFGQVPKLINQ